MEIKHPRNDQKIKDIEFLDSIDIIKQIIKVFGAEILPLVAHEEGLHCVLYGKDEKGAIRYVKTKSRREQL